MNYWKSLRMAMKRVLTYWFYAIRKKSIKLLSGLYEIRKMPGNWLRKLLSALTRQFQNSKESLLFIPGFSGYVLISASHSPRKNRRTER
jgi:hypothetical protein